MSTMYICPACEDEYTTIDALRKHAFVIHLGITTKRDEEHRTVRGRAQEDNILSPIAGALLYD